MNGIHINQETQEQIVEINFEENQNQFSLNNHGNVINTEDSNVINNTSNTDTNTNDNMDINTNDNDFATNDTNQR